jgi:TRAP-type C4-dicarboxylate transport system permease large subunit
MDPITIGLLGLATLILLVALRMPIAYAMILVGGVGVMIMNGPATVMNQLKTLAYGQFSNYGLSVIPMFVLMGAIASKTGLSQALFRAANAWLGWARGGTAMAAIAGCAGFGAVSGSSLATASTMGKIALPELKRYNYSGSLATGTLAAGGVLGILIPPSVVLIIYAIIVEANIVTLFMAAMIPGALAVMLFLVTIAIYVADPSRGRPLRRRGGPAGIHRGHGGHAARSLHLRHRSGRHLRGLLQPHPRGGHRCGAGSGSLRTGETQPVVERPRRQPEGDGRHHRHDLPDPFGCGTGQDLHVPHPHAPDGGGMDRVLGAGADDRAPAPSAGADPSRLPDGLVSMILLVIPFFWPVLVEMNGGLFAMGPDTGFGMSTEELKIWFGILALIVVELGLITPPVGMNVFVISALAKDTPMWDTFKGVMPFFAAEIFRVGLLIAFPAIVLWLPAVLR